jgi:aryl-alcohol dehydrogenase-like predicted oxidoreductase
MKLKTSNQFHRSKKVNQSHRLVLGTAQLGMAYGIANSTGQPDMETATDILETAWKGGIRQFDTAQGYGDSERVLGKVLTDLGVSDKAKIISKLDPAIDHKKKESVRRAVYNSLDDLNISCLHGLMIHREEIIDYFEDGLCDTLNELIAEGLIKNAGVSVYSPNRAHQAIKYNSIKLLQFPANIFDHRFQKYSIFKFAEQNEKIIYLRSIFLQGLILINISEIPDRFKSAQGILRDLVTFSQQLGVDRNAIAIGYIKKKFPKSFVIFGAETAIQVKNNLSIWEEFDFSNELMGMIENRYFNVEEDIVNPLRWKH